MALTANTPRNFDLGEINEVGVAANAVIYEGAAIGSTGGYARPLTAGDTFLGFALAAATGTSANAGVNVRVSSTGKIRLSISALAVTDIQKPVYASDDGTFTLTATSNSYIGVVHRWVSTGIGIIAFSAAQPGGTSGITVLTDSGGGAAANNTIEAITAPTAITNSSGSAASNGTIEAVTAPTAISATITDSTGYSGTHGDTLNATTVPADYTGGEAVTEAEGNTLLALLRVMAQNTSNNGQKVIELVTAQAANRLAIIALTDSIGEFATAQTANRTAIVAITDAIKELSTKTNEIINAQR